MPGLGTWLRPVLGVIRELVLAATPDFNQQWAAQEPI